MSMERVVKFASDFRTIWLAMALVLVAVVAAADQRYAPAGDYITEVALAEINKKNRLENQLWQTKKERNELLLKDNLSDYEKRLLKLKQQEIKELNDELNRMK